MTAILITVAIGFVLLQVNVRFRVRENPQLPNVVRPRWSLGLLHPNGR